MKMDVRPPMTATRFDAALEEALFAAPANHFYNNFFKRVFDIALISIVAIPAFLIIAFFALLVALDGKSPIYFQTRVGRNGRTFKMLKLRSMVPNADEMLKSYLAKNPAARAEWDLHQKLKNDPRVTRVGRIIRKTSLDELPQLINVLRGDMSLVGPRPMMVDQQPMYPGSAYFALRPGITGLWQISARNSCSFATRAKYDAEYLRKQSFVTDVKIMFRTVGVVLNGTGC